MLHIQITGYCESTDSLQCVTHDSVADSVYDMRLPASILPYIAPDVVSGCEDPPFDLIGTSFELTSPLID